jgi:hypothetical protein
MSEAIKMSTATQKYDGLLALSEIEGRTDITRENLVDIITQERALRIVAGVIESGENTPKTQAVLSLLQEHYGSRIQEAYGNELKLLQGNV